MKNTVKRTLIIPAMLAATLLLAACGGGSSTAITCTETASTALHESAFAQNANLCATPGKVVVLLLEAKTATAGGAGDSGGAGYDVIPYKIANAGTYTFEVEADGENIHELALKDKDGAELLRVKAGAGPKSVNIPAGNYAVHMSNGGAKAIPYFLRTHSSPSVSAVATRTTLGAQQLAMPEAAKYRDISSDDPFPVSNNLWTASLSCQNCDLSYIDFTTAEIPYANQCGLICAPTLQKLSPLLDGADLSYSNLFSANLRGVGLRSTILIGANLTDANLTSSDQTGAELMDSTLVTSIMKDANLTGANLTGANLTIANLSGASLTGANLTNANLTRDGLQKSPD